MTDKKLQSIVGRNIRAFRKQKSWTLEKLASQADIDWGFLSRIETGVRALSLPMVAKISSALGVEPSDLLVDPTSTSKGGQDRRFQSHWSSLGREERADLLAILARKGHGRDLKALKQLLRD